MNILVTNDDGISSKGIALLIEKAKFFGDVYVVAPKNQQSAVGQGLTIHEPIQINKENNLFEDVKASYSVSAKPADCVKVALEYLRFDIDLVLSGVNDGPNLGTDILYSGTVGAASEACVFNIPSIAFSTDYGYYEIVERELEDTIRFILNNNIISPKTIVNVNFPLNNNEESKGIKFTNQGERVFSAKFRHDNGKYWQEGDWVEKIQNRNTDVMAAKEGFISISPLSIVRTDFTALNDWKNKINLED